MERKQASKPIHASICHRLCVKCTIRVYTYRQENVSIKWGRRNMCILIYEGVFPIISPDIQDLQAIWSVQQILCWVPYYHFIVQYVSVWLVKYYMHGWRSFYEQKERKGKKTFLFYILLHHFEFLEAYYPYTLKRIIIVGNFTLLQLLWHWLWLLALAKNLM